MAWKNESGDVLFATCLELAFVAAFGSLIAIYFYMIYDSIWYMAMHYWTRLYGCHCLCWSLQVGFWVGHFSTFFLHGLYWLCNQHATQSFALDQTWEVLILRLRLESFRVNWCKLCLQRFLQRAKAFAVRLELFVVRCCAVVLEMSPTCNTQASYPRWTGRAFPFEGAVQLGVLINVEAMTYTLFIWQGLLCVPLNTKQQQQLARKSTA